MSALVANDYEWPSGQTGVQIVVHSHVVGYAAHVDGGYLVRGKRKPVATIESAAKQCIDAQISAHHNEIEKLRKMLNAVLRYNVKVRGRPLLGDPSSPRG